MDIADTKHNDVLIFAIFFKNQKTNNPIAT